MKKQIARWARHAGGEFRVWFDSVRRVSQGAARRAGSWTLTDLAYLSWIAVFLVITVLIVQELRRDLVTIEPIATPETFTKAGYTPEVASRRLHDALNNYADNANSMMRMHVAQSNDLPDFVVPKLDLSINAIVTSIRTALHYRDSQRITGEFIQQGKLSLRVRVDGHEVYRGSNEGNDPDALLAEAAAGVMDKIRPYLVASTMYDTDKTGAVEKADEIIARVGESDINAQWSYILKGHAMVDQKKFDEAEKFDRKAIELGWYNWVAHNNLGGALKEQGKLDEGIAQFKRAIEVDPSAVLPRYNLAVSLRQKAGPDGKLDAVLASYQRALDVDPHYSPALRGLGLVLQQRGDLDSAIAQFRRAIKFASQKDLELALYHYNLGWALVKKAGDDGKLDEAIAECRAALEFASDKDTNLALYHFELAYALAKQAGNDGNLDEAISHYQSAIIINPKYSLAHNNLGVLWRNQGKLDDAIGEYREAIADDPNYTLAKQNLEAALKLQQEKIANK